MKRIEDIVFYKLEKAIKKYRQFAQKRISDNGIDITIDQWLVLITIKENENHSQRQISEMVFKDYASVTRIIEILVKKGFLKRNIHSQDRRRFVLSITTEGEKVISKVYPIVLQNRDQALESLSNIDIEYLKTSLDRIIANCK